MSGGSTARQFVTPTQNSPELNSPSGITDAQRLLKSARYKLGGSTRPDFSKLTYSEVDPQSFQASADSPSTFPAGELKIGDNSGDIFAGGSSSNRPNLQEQFNSFSNAKPFVMEEPTKSEDPKASLFADALKRVGGQPAQPNFESQTTDPASKDEQSATASSPEIKLPAHIQLASAANFADAEKLASVQTQFRQLAQQLSDQAVQLDIEDQATAAKYRQTPNSLVGDGLIAYAQKLAMHFAKKLSRKKSLSEIATQLANERKAKMHSNRTGQAFHFPKSAEITAKVHKDQHHENNANTGA